MTRSDSATGRPYVRKDSPRGFFCRSIVGICNSWSEINNCNLHLLAVAEPVKPGVLEMDGFPRNFNPISVDDELMMPTAMLYRSLMAMEVAEVIRSHPIDGVALLCGCDMTTLVQLMAVASMDVPSIIVPGGLMLGGMWRNQSIRSGTDVWNYWDERHA